MSFRERAEEAVFRGIARGIVAWEQLRTGAALARLEARHAIGALVRRFPRLRLAREPLAWGDNTILRGPRSLPVLV
ncbi:MAG TPA: hypothetical protein VFG80_06125 [Myxococcota bacterium]|nr:hypothetical protein [Myxococcota bacterium]